MTDAELKAELTNDPAGLGYSGKTASQILLLINSPRESITFPAIVPVATILLVLDASLEAVESLQNAVKKEAWRARLQNIRALKEGFKPADVASVLAQGVTDGVITQQQVNTINTLGTRLGSRAEQLWGEGFAVTLNDVARVF